MSASQHVIEGRKPLPLDLIAQAIPMLSKHELAALTIGLLMLSTARTVIRTWNQRWTVALPRTMALGQSLSMALSDGAATMMRLATLANATMQRTNAG